MNILDNKKCSAFIAVAKMGSFEGASKELFITPSAVSLRIQALEEELGCMLVERTRPCTVTQSGYELLNYLRTADRLQQNLLDNLSGMNTNSLQELIIASNADSLATWLLPSLQETLIQQKVVLKLHLDDQTQTHNLLKSGLVNACISTKKQSITGCQTIYLGKMLYQMVATNDFIEKWFSLGVTRETLQNAPAVIFNDKDLLHFDFLEKHYGLLKGSYPYHCIPASDSFVSSIALGLGYGLVPTIQNILYDNKSKGVLQIMITEGVNVDLYWHYWKNQSKALEILMHQVVDKSRAYLQ